MVLAVAMSIVLALPGPGEVVTYCDPAVVIPPPGVSANFLGEVVRVAQEQGGEAGILRQTAEVAPRSSVSGPAPQQNVTIAMEFDPRAPCAHFQPQLRVGRLVRIYMDSEGGVSTWTLVPSPSDPDEYAD